MVVPGVESVIITDCVQVYFPAAGVKTGNLVTIREAALMDAGMPRALSTAKQYNNVVRLKHPKSLQERPVSLKPLSVSNF